MDQPLLKKRKKPRLLAPIKSFNGVVKVINAGADEVYCDVYPPRLTEFVLHRGPFCALPSYEELERVVKYAHDNCTKVLLTANIPFMTEAMEEPMREHIQVCIDSGIDGLIIGDMGLLLLLKEMSVDTALIASTFFVSMNLEAVDFLVKLGVRRVILERQLTLDEMARIAEYGNAEIEIFIHGGGCSNLNGRCYLLHLHENQELRNALAEIDGIKAPCMLSFEVFDLTSRLKLGEHPVLDAATWCSICRLPELLRIGAAGFKIVGRCFNEEYQEKTTRLYRELIDLVWNGQLDSFYAKVQSLKKNFYPLLPPTLNLEEYCCEQERCYYSKFFHAPYKIPLSLSSWTKFQFKKVYEH